LIIVALFSFAKPPFSLSNAPPWPLPAVSARRRQAPKAKRHNSVKFRSPPMMIIAAHP